MKFPKLLVQINQISQKNPIRSPIQFHYPIVKKYLQSTMASQTPFKLKAQADKGFQDGSTYDKHRPTYPPSSVDKLLTHLGVAGQQGARIVDLAAGTGKFTELLAARPEQFEIVAVEPHAGMRGTLEEKKLQGVVIKDGDAGNIGLEDSWGDALIAAQAFHWFATRESLKEIHRVLRPGASFGMIWNIESYNSPKDWKLQTNWETKLRALTWTFEDSQPRFRHQKWKEVFEKDRTYTTPLQTIRDTLKQDLPDFSLPLGEETEEWTVWLSEEALWERYSTLSQISVLQGEELKKTKETFADALRDESVERNEIGEVAVHGITYAAWTSRV